MKCDAMNIQFSYRNWVHTVVSFGGVYWFHLQD